MHLSKLLVIHYKAKIDDAIGRSDNETFDVSQDLPSSKNDNWFSNYDLLGYW
ncbi:hypothetical protein [Rubripirellula reticaptiva]|uniref:Uncharacterized protein n=1 Tax=Rubripirellula reticaptiva TaxID=2528013 RepID=A0A5C6ET61_9BACT|nr:hypothetical protein [Rubripirellula reticaptiva]TWU51277.1 hypothetical protein Poly59_28690 [Rubripirellula reticaptiva]